MVDLPSKPKMRGLYAITPDMEDTDRLYEMVGHALAGGACWLQYRNKTADSRLRLLQARTIQPLCQQFHVPLIINDHLDIALEIGADGLHVGQGDISVAVARHHLGQNKTIGASCYNQLDRAINARKAGVDYVAFGAFYPSLTKIDTNQATIDLLDEARERLDIPIVAIGGINSGNVEILVRRGCHAIAVSQGLFEAQDIQATARHFSGLFG